MSPQYDYPGVYIEEVTGPGVIAGVSTSTAGFVGPALDGPLGSARRVTTFDDFVRLYGGTRDGRPFPYLYRGTVPFHLAFAVEAFFRNGGAQAFVARIGTARRASLTVANAKPEPAFVVEAVEEGVAGDALQLAVEPSAQLSVAVGATTLTADPVGTTLTVADAAPFRVGDVVTVRAADRTITQLQGTTLTLDSAPPNAAVSGDPVRIADIANGSPRAFRLVSTEDLVPGATVLLNGNVADRGVIETVNAQTGAVAFRGGAPKKIDATGTPFLTVARTLATASAAVTSAAEVPDAQGRTVTRLRVSVGNAKLFSPGDVVKRGGAPLARITRIAGTDLFLDVSLAGQNGNVRLALVPGQTTFRLDRGAGLAPGSLLKLSQGETVVVAGVTAAGLVTVTGDPAITNAYDLTAAVAPTAIAQGFRLVVSSTADSRVERVEGLSPHPSHPRYVLNPGVVASDRVGVLAPPTPPTAITPAQLLVPAAGATALAGGADDTPENLTAVHYQAGLDVLRDVDEVSLVIVPDAAAHPDRQAIQLAQIEHCLSTADRFAILDPPRGAPPDGPGSVAEHRTQVTADRGVAALYYPWLLVSDPSAAGARGRTLAVPPSGAIAGVFARTDQERGVHKAPANTDVRGALGLERRLSDRQQGPLNLQGVNVLRIFPGDARVVVWGARTTVQPDVTDWLYVSVRRLMLYLEESVQQGLRWAVFEPNDLALWQGLRRTIGAFLTGVWRDGGLFGATAEEAFSVRIDEGLNPPSERALGRLHIEIRVAPVRPAEFIVVRIGLWDGGGDVNES